MPNYRLQGNAYFDFLLLQFFFDKVKLGLVPLDIFGIILRIPYLYDRKVVFYRHENRYNLIKDGVEYIVRAHRKKLNISLVNAVKWKRLVNASKNFVLLMIKKKDDIDYESFEGCDEKLKSDLFDVVS